MRLFFRLTGLVLASALATGCAAKAAPLVPTGDPALNAPEPPARVVVPAPEQPTLPPVEDPPATDPTAPARPARTTPPRPVVVPPPTEPPAAPPAGTVSPPVLLTSANTAEFEKRVRGQLALAQTNLAQVNRRNLGTDAKAQYDAALGFIHQAEDALKVKNLVYAGQLADKAATMAALLRR